MIYELIQTLPFDIKLKIRNIVYVLNYQPKKLLDDVINFNESKLSIINNSQLFFLHHCLHELMPYSYPSVRPAFPIPDTDVYDSFLFINGINTIFFIIIPLETFLFH